MITWYNCSIDNGKTNFGFSVKNGIIQDKFPDYKLIGHKVSDVRGWFLLNRAKVVQVAIQYETLEELENSKNSNNAG